MIWNLLGNLIKLKKHIRCGIQKLIVKINEHLIGLYPCDSLNTLLYEFKNYTLQSIFIIILIILISIL